MADEPKFRGTGITREQVFDYNDPAAADIVERATVEGLCSQIERECFAIMRANDLPDRHRSYYHDDAGNWTFKIPPGGPWGWHCCNDLSSIVRQRGYEPDSSVGFAAGMLCDVVWLRRALQDGDGDWAAMHAFYLGIKWAKRGLKEGWEKAALAGQKSLEGSSDGGAKRAAAYAVRHEAIRRDFAERLERLSDEARAKEATAKHFDITRRQLNRILAK